LKSRTGSGYCIVHKMVVIAAEAIPLGNYPTVFQAEITAINSAAVKLLDYAHLGKVAIYCDSLAALMALDSTKVKTGTVLSTIMNLDGLSWVKTHIGTQGNELSNRLAKTWTVKVPKEAEPIIPVPITQKKRDIREAVERKWIAQWTLTKEARQSKLFWAKADHNHMKAMV
jgi:hypothetical protein